MTDLNNPKVQKILHSKAFAHLATIGPDGAPQSSPMWFLWDGEHLKFTHTTHRKKYQNIQRDPRVAVSITDMDDPYTYAEFRGIVERIEEDPTGAFYDTLAKHYDVPWGYSGDPRVILYVSHLTHECGGLCLNSTATQHIFADVLLWLQRSTHPSPKTLGVLTKRPSLPSLAEQGAFSM